MEYALIRSKKATYVCVSKNDSCDLSAADAEFVRNTIGKAETVTEGVYRLPLEFDEATLISNGFISPEKSRAKTVLAYCKEMGNLKR